uniref:Uncharacterized protein n=1 Tax=Candidatus Kentrum sp. LPFa TaxID=2126335 RepID=A0A450VSM1_9GAMM|nr:MAG: hypothetical protein BECKLPF1236A_GA0070988_1001118 [Candidatus Kentron sp. LPFa]VFK29739.1 MAG: hypothetical protein BECKLPF1236C_GA0070990_1009311 [Candidatus Kentron sp. LPFa]
MDNFLRFRILCKSPLYLNSGPAGIPPEWKVFARISLDIETDIGLSREFEERSRSAEFDAIDKLGWLEFE